MAEQDIEIDIESGEEKISEAVNDKEELDDSETSSDDSEPPLASESGDKELNDADDDEEREAIRARRREERKHRKESQRNREDTLRRELASRDAIINELRGKVDGIERRNTGSEMAQLENAKKQTAQSYAFFKDQIRIATEAGNGAAVADATEKLIQSQRKFDELVGIERNLKQRQSTPQALDPRLISNAQKWMERNSWYDASASDQDSEIVMKLDQRLAQEGWDPTTSQYWEELDSRVKKYLPHRVTRDKITSNKPRSVVTGSGRESGNSGNSGSYKLSADRVSALKDAGIWDDPKQRAEAVKRFRDYDKQNQG
jgi:hypothetical protein